MITKTAAIAAINATKITRGCKMIAADVINEIEDSPVVVVTGCDGCPLNSGQYLDYESCMHPEHKRTYDTKYNQFKGCPLIKTNSLTIQLETI